MEAAPRHAVQGYLFEMAGETACSGGYRGSTAAKVAGISLRQLDYWARKQIVTPSIRSLGPTAPSSHGGMQGLYVFRDVVILAVSKKLLDAGASLRNVTMAIDSLKRHTTDDLYDIIMACDGETVYECTTDEQLMRLIHDGRTIFGISVGTVCRQVGEALAREEFVVSGTEPNSVSGTTSSATAMESCEPLDEFTARRLRRQRELRTEQARNARLPQAQREGLEA
ncbi:MerR family transcriptional regulator [Bifidobacterium callimiconis]|nr:MerR family transcriptional regulator [Bifidobacterium callimiconis]